MLISSCNCFVVWQPHPWWEKPYWHHDNRSSSMTLSRYEMIIGSNCMSTSKCKLLLCLVKMKEEHSVRHSGRMNIVSILSMLGETVTKLMLLPNFQTWSEGKSSSMLGLKHLPNLLGCPTALAMTVDNWHIYWPCLHVWQPTIAALHGWNWVCCTSLLMYWMNVCTQCSMNCYESTLNNIVLILSYAGWRFILL